MNSLSVLCLGKKRSDNEIIRQLLSDGLRCSVFFDTAANLPDYAQLVEANKYDLILVDYAVSFFCTPVFVRSAVTAGIPVVYLLDTSENDASLALITEGAAGCVLRNDSDLLLSVVHKALSGQVTPDFTDQAYVTDDNELLALEILDNLEDAFYIVDHEWRLKFINHQAELRWGCRRNDLLGRNFWDCFSHLKQTAEMEKNQIAMNERIPMQWESSSPDYSSWAEICVYPIRNGGLAVFLRRITEKKRAEEVLRLSRDRQAVMLRLSDSLRLLDNPGEIQEVAARIIGEYLGAEKAFYCDVVTIDGVEYFALDRVYSATENHTSPNLYPIDSPGMFANEKFEGHKIIVCDMESDPRISDDIRPNLRAFRLSAWISVPLIRNGRFTATFTVHQPTPRNWTPEEISLIEETTARTWAEVDRVRAEEALRKSEQHALQLVAELENADRNKNNFINALSHELRNPLTAIVSNLSLLDILDSKPDARKAKMIIKRQTEQLSHLVDDLLDLTRITNNKIQLNPELLDLNELALASACDQRTQFDEKGIELVTEIGEKPLYISADPFRVSQIIGNLLHNAYKFTKKGGITVLSVSQQDSSAVIHVKDTGIGIDLPFLPELFKTFKQFDQNKGGLGLGLSIVKGLVELHKGTVAAHSEGLNRGAVFTVRLPLHVNPGIMATAETKAEEQQPQQLKVLLIDDNRDLAETTASLLALYSYNVKIAYTGLSGIQIAQEFLPHVIICDIGLPDIDGYEVARRISGCGELGNVWLISLSGYAQAGDFENSKEAGFALHISKPVHFDNLRKILDSIKLE